MRHRIFIGSSTEALNLAEALQVNLTRRGHTVKVWDQGVFAVGKNILEGLLQALDKFDAAIFVFAPNDLVSIRGQQFEAVRDNVIFELGLFTGKLGRDRTFWVVPQGQQKLRIASDLLGVVPAEYVEPRDGDWANALSVPSRQIHEALIESARHRGTTHPPLSHGVMATCLSRVNDVMTLLAGAVTSDALTVAESRIEPIAQDGGFRLPLSRKSDLRLSFGRIEDCSCDETGGVVVLPANEFFDDACITDHKSALGAFVKHHFDGKVDEFQKLVAKRRETLPEPTFVEREQGLYQESYGVGTSLWLERPLGSKCSLILCAVTRKRAGEGIRAEPAYVFAGMQSVSRIMNDQKRTDLHVPLLGAGHGDLVSEVALLCLALSLTRAPHVRHAEIVVYRRNAESEPEIAPAQVRKVLAFASCAVTR